MEPSLFQASVPSQQRDSALNGYELYGNDKGFMLNNNNDDYASNAEGFHIDVTTIQHKNTTGRVHEPTGTSTSSLCVMANGGQGSYYDELHASDVKNHFIMKSKYQILYILRYSYIIYQFSEFIIISCE